MRQSVQESPEFRADVIASQAEGDIRLEPIEFVAQVMTASQAEGDIRLEPIEFVAQVMTASLEQQRLPRLTTIGMS